MMTDLLGGHVDMAFDTIATTKPHIDSGILRAIGATMAKRPPSAPEIRTFDEQGLKGFVGGSWVGFVLLALAASLLAASTGLMVAAIGGTEARARSVSILVILGVSMVGGLWLPAFLLPAWVSDIALSLPTTWAMRGLDAVTWQGRGLAAALPGVGVVLAFAVGFLALAAWRLSASEARLRRGV